MPWTPAQAASRRANAAERRTSLLRKKSDMETHAFVRQATEAMEGKHGDKDDVDPRTGISTTRDYATDQPVTTLISLTGVPKRVPRAAYKKAVKAFGWRVARDLAFRTNYFSHRWPKV